VCEFTGVSEIPVNVNSHGILEMKLNVINTWRNSAKIDLEISEFHVTNILVYDGTLKKDIDTVVELVLEKRAAAILLL